MSIERNSFEEPFFPNEKLKIARWRHELDQARAEEAVEEEGGQQEKSEKKESLFQETIDFYSRLKGSRPESEVDKIIEGSLLREASDMDNEQFDKEYMQKLEEGDKKEFGRFHGFTFETIEIPKKLGMEWRKAIQPIFERQFLGKKFDSLLGWRMNVASKNFKQFGTPAVEIWFQGSDEEIEVQFLDEKLFPNKELPLTFRVERDGEVRIEMPYVESSKTKAMIIKRIKELSPEKLYILMRMISEETEKKMILEEAEKIIFHQDGEEKAERE